MRAQYSPIEVESIQLNIVQFNLKVIEKGKEAAFRECKKLISAL